MTTFYLVLSAVATVVLVYLVHLFLKTLQVYRETAPETWEGSYTPEVAVSHSKCFTQLWVAVGLAGLMLTSIIEFVTLAIRAGQV